MARSKSVLKDLSLNLDSLQITKVFPGELHVKAIFKINSAEGQKVFNDGKIV